MGVHFSLYSIGSNQSRSTKPWSNSYCSVLGRFEERPEDQMLGRFNEPDRFSLRPLGLNPIFHLFRSLPQRRENSPMT
ncbi:hypothetical protein V6N12_068684 [Hibiscus sabdariffa]|uniref:Uncharacterized protein n=1 Tax=Hibiscus sabdariffa TaxID=183260 RepID=A0ABR2FQM9_9ROSI